MQGELSLTIQPGSFVPTSAAASMLASYGLPISVSRLNVLRSIGGGPKFHRFGRRVVYTEADLKAWVVGKSAHKFNSTSEYDALPNVKTRGPASAQGATP
jgi:hypothetical protein